ncbi:GTP pyrophosphokinase [Methylomagnum ishizawai]|uniref:GTP pyrophosphokinase n=1 Tax=Methylomagnum ishizawai TaxID=1760988 RepID=A0A1Y6D151_9GAMM|nr:bifunctional (p)ppGpp synthetase/guanosine-3',5'-bis(diphosphate) 3'-pyrophosphohydrolase [Methylomagnum ishizawai]SMF96341.1 GTP pyrophosphokinase [Methylomagnum ishizawai]
MKHSHYHADISSRPNDELLARLSAGYKDEERGKIAEALELAVKARDNDTLVRPRGIDVAHTLHNLKVDAPTLQIALLSDPYLRDTLDEHEIEHRFGPAIAELVRKVNWLNTFDEYRPDEPKQPDQAELLRRMLLAVVNDVRGVVVKLAYRLQRLRLLKDQDQDEHQRRKIALETLDIFAPLANRLGVGQLKWELEDLSFRYLEPEEYKRLAKSLAANRAEREGFIHRFMADLREEFEAQGIKVRVFGRPKHIYSIHRKMTRKDVPLDELYDLHAVRAIVEDVPSCYAVLGLVHSRWLHIPREFDDYIANPKDNGYQSLHTVVVGPEGRPVEIQIRTEEMHAFAEYGVAAHWRYKEGGRQDAALDRSINALRRLLENKEDETILESFRAELFEDQIFVLTPKGQVIRLRKGATPVDFAYAIHTEVGHHCRGAKVNGRMVQLTHALKSGDKVEVLTTKAGGPSLGWLDGHLGYVKTAHARGKIRAWFRQQDHEKHLKAGKTILDRERQKMGVKEVDLEELARHFHLPHGNDVLLAVGRADISAAQLAGVLKPADWQPPRSKVPVVKKPVPQGHAKEEVTIQGIRNLLTHMARCCAPVPGDPIVGYITIGRGIAIHRRDCVNVLQLREEKHSRLIEVAWGEEQETFPVELEVRALDRKGLLKDIAHVLSAEHINILRSNTLTDPDKGDVVMLITAEVADLAQLSQALDRIGEIHNVLGARRKEHG